MNQEKLIEYIREINGQGTTILLSALQMSLVERVANKVFLINNGEELYYGSLLGIYNAFGKKQIIELQLESKVNEAIFQNINEVESVDRIDEYRVKLSFSNETGLKSILHELAGIKGICDITRHKPNLHEIFLQLVKSDRQ